MTHLVNRHIKALIKCQEAGERPQRQSGDTRNRQYPADNRAYHIAHITELHIDRTDNIDQIVGTIRTVIKIIVQFPELFYILFFMTEDFDHLLPFHHLFDKSVHLTQIFLLLQEIASA